MLGRTVGHYRIIDRLGEGGMGVVWRAEDTRLGRQVALKVLSGRLAADETALQRFEAEARLAGSINHPHIVAIYDIGPLDEGRFIAMELVEGENLDQAVRSRQLRLSEALDWALHVAEALAAAHRAGILHRDVKPANIYVARGGYAKLGDFGVAKLREQVSDPAATVGPELTQGSIVGSPHYLSPEQAQGEPLDARTDVFSFAATLYEMLTGRQAFPGRSSAEVVTRILREDPPPPSELRPDVPPALEALVLKGLEKRREFRSQHMEDVAADLRRIRRDLDTRRPAAPPPRAAPRRMAAPLAAALAVGVLAGGLLVWALAPGREVVTTAAPFELVRLTSEAGLEHAPSWSPDGRSLVYTSDAGGYLGLWLRQVPGERAIRIGLPGVDEAQPAWSPDGNWIAFVSSRNRSGRFGIFLGARPIEIYVHGQGGDLFVMPALGGTARKLADDAYDPSWSPDGRRLAFRSVRDGTWRLYTVSIEDGRIEPVRGVEPRALAPAWSPDGRWIAYVASASAATGWDLYVVPAAGGDPVQLTRDETTIALRPAWSRDGRAIVYSSNRAGPLNLWRAGFDPDAPGPTGPPERLTVGIGEDIDPAESPDGSRVAYATVHTAPDIWQLELASGRVRQLTSETTVEDYPRLSPDGERLLFYSDRSGREEVWVMHLASGDLTRVSREGGAQNAWSPDGELVAYGTTTGLKIVNLTTGETRTLAESLSTAYPAFSPDGRQVCFQGWDGREYRLYIVPVAGGAPERVPTPEGEPGDPSWAPDGRTLYFQLDQFGRRNIWSVDLTTEEPRQLTAGDADDAHPDVSSDGGEVLFLRHHRDLYVMPTEGEAEPRLLYGFRERNRLVEWPAWGPGDETVVFSVAEMRGDLFLLQPATPEP